MRRTLPILALSLFLFTSGCPGTTQPPPRTGPDRVPALAGFPATALVPASATAVVAVRRLATLSEFLRGAIEPLRILDSRRTADGLDQEFRREWGVSPLELGDLEDAGFDGAGDVVVFASGASPTIALRVGDEARLKKLLAERTKAVTTYLKQHRGHEVTSWSYAPRTRASFLVLRGYFLLHLEELSADQPAPPKGGWGGKLGAPAEAGMAWLDEIMDAGAKGVSGPGWVLERTSGELRDLVAFVDPARLAAAARTLAGKARRADCDKLDTGLAGIARAGAAFKLQKRSLRGQAVLELGDAAQKELRAQLERAAVALPRPLFAKAPVRAEWRVSPSYLATVAGTYSSRECGMPYTWLAEYLSSSRLADLIRRNGGFLSQLGSALSAALFSSDEKGQGTFVFKAALVARCKGAAIDYVRRSLPIASGEKEKIAGREVEKVSPQERTLQERVRVLLADDLLRLTSGEDLMESLLGAAPPVAEDQLLAIRLEPGKVADLRSLLKLLEDQPASPSPWGGYYGRRQAEELDQLANLLSSYAKLELGARLRGALLDLSLEYRLR